MRHILVTGGAGFIGSNLIGELLNRDFKVTAIDNFDDFYSRGQKELNIKPFETNPDFKFIEGDIRETADLEQIPDIHIIIHLAAKAGVRPSIKNPILYQDVNVSGTQTLLEFAKSREIKQFIFASSSSVYGINENVPWNEEEKLLPISPYASTKLSGEMLGHVYSKLYGIRFLALRFFTVYGPGQRPDLAIHKFFKSILNNQPIPVFGDGSTSRDYTFVGDTVKGLIAAIDYDKSDFEIINLGNHNTVTLSELIEAVEDVCGKKAQINRLEEQPGDVPRTYADISKAENLLNYHPSTNLKDGLKEFYRWYNTNQAILQ
ncbi:MAG: GDP-mannose 4,6-dehydratase [Sphingobacteriaceae bacterium]|nr:GDP-mannose 4,6-dehydratase [Sphingobacteriaceae bacterium]